jgi:hypothetical protein
MSRRRRPPSRARVQPQPWLEPNSSEWLLALAEHGPWQACLFAEVVGGATRLDICSICGDDPAPIYDCLEPLHLSVRLCDDCLRIQVHTFGAQLVPHRQRRRS